MKYITTILFLNAYIFVGLAQNKKEQIEVLNFSIDSLIIANSNLKTILVEKDIVITEKEILIKKNQAEITELNKNISLINKNNSELIILNAQLKKTNDSLNSLLKTKQIIKYSLRNIEGVGDNCNCGCDAEKQVNGIGNI